MSFITWEKYEPERRTDSGNAASRPFIVSQRSARTERRLIQSLLQLDHRSITNTKLDFE